MLAHSAYLSCFHFAHSFQHRAGVCGLDKDVFQITNPGFSFIIDTLLKPELSRALKLTQPLELLLTNFSLYLAHCAHMLPQSSSLGLVCRSLLSWGDLQKNCSSHAQCPQCSALARLPVRFSSFPSDIPSHTVTNKERVTEMFITQHWDRQDLGAVFLHTPFPDSSYT